MLNRPPPWRESPSQTAGPYVHLGCTPNDCGVDGVWAADLGAVMLTPETKGERVVVEGRVFDGSGAPVIDAVIEIWQADAAGFYPVHGAADPAFSGFGRRATDDSGAYRFETVKPGRVAHAGGGTMAPHISVWIVARGINIGLHTRVYFADERSANADDPVLSRVDPRRRETLVAGHCDASGVSTYRFDVHLQGDDETAFFDI